MEVPPNGTPESVQSLYDNVIEILATYGWTILFLLVVANLLWSHFEPKFRKWREKVEDQKKEEEYIQNPERIFEREEALARARQKLQEKHDMLAKEYEEKMREREEKKRQEKIEAYERLNKGKSMTASNNSSSLRQEYNPLMGTSGPSCSYRPSRRGFGGGGGG